MPSPTVENYIKQIYLEQQSSTGGESEALVPMGRLAAAMGVVPGTATTMVKALSDSGLVAYEPRGGVRLTRGGEQLALHVLRRHRLVELFLVKVLGLDWSEVHEEAEELEHAVSDKVLERMDQVLGHPSVDPHGDPIPSAKGKVDESRHGSLADCARAASDQTVAPPTANMSARRLTHAPKLKFTHFPERISRLDPGSDTRSRSVRELDR